MSKRSAHTNMSNFQFTRIYCPVH